MAEWHMAIAQIELKPAAAGIHRSVAQIQVVFSGYRLGKTRPDGALGAGEAS